MNYGGPVSTLRVDQTKPICDQITQATWVKDRFMDEKAGCLLAWLRARYQPVTSEEQYQKILIGVSETILEQYPSRGQIQLVSEFFKFKTTDPINPIRNFNDHRDTTLDDVKLVLMWAGY